jgi:hypothetical protein
LEAAVLLLLMGVTYKVRRFDGLRWHNIYTEFHEDWFGKVTASTIWEVAPLVLLMKGFMVYTVDMTSDGMTYTY